MTNSPSVPVKHFGKEYTSFLSTLSEKRRVARYLEVGVSKGRNLSFIHADVAVGVDPHFKIEYDISKNKRVVVLHQTSSDEFFENAQAVGMLGGAPDLVFLDGMHHFEFLLRDFMNCEAICRPGSLIAMHDCLPLNATMTFRDIGYSVKAGEKGNFSNWWTGDVWKIIPILNRYRPDLELILLDCAPTGLVCVKNLIPGNRVLREHYDEIVAEFGKGDASSSDIEELYKNSFLHSATDVLDEIDNNRFGPT